MKSHGRRRCSFRRSEHGGFALLFAIMLPVLAVLGLGSVELVQLVSDQQATQDVADAAALWGASQLGVSPEGVDQRTQAEANAQLAQVASHAQTQVTASILDKGQLKVAIDTYRMSFFGNMLPLGGFRTHVESTAEALNFAPLCVLVFGSHAQSYQTQKQNLNIDGSAALTAPSCAVYSDQDITVGGGSGGLTAAAVEAVGQAHGPISPSPAVGASYVPDPFSSVDVDFPSNCIGQKVQTIITSDTTLAAGLHCDEITVEKGAVLTLAPGEHYFGGNLTLQDTSSLAGDDVVLDFDQHTKFDFNGESVVTLQGRKSGPLAGFVIASDRKNKQDFTIASDHVGQLVGTVYIPMAKLVVNGQDKVAQSSPWTVIVAQSVQVSGNSNLVINSQYSTSTVPVPTGVGPTNSGAKLIR